MKKIKNSEENFPKFGDNIKPPTDPGKSSSIADASRLKKESFCAPTPSPALVIKRLLTHSKKTW
jgi:hypothetical protein